MAPTISPHSTILAPSWNAGHSRCHKSGHIVRAVSEIHSRHRWMHLDPHSKMSTIARNVHFRPCCRNQTCPFFQKTINTSGILLNTLPVLGMIEVKKR